MRGTLVDILEKGNELAQDTNNYIVSLAALGALVGFTLYISSKYVQRYLMSDSIFNDGEIPSAEDFVVY